ncbi:MAG: hypothetical protein AB7K68_01930 [Bacteriovoracia bacterium]
MISILPLICRAHKAISRGVLLGLLFFSASAQALTVSPSALRLEDKKAGNVLLGAEDAVIEAGEVYRTVLLLWGHLDIYGNADEVLVLSGHVVFHEGSKLNKSLVVMGGSYETLPGATIKNENVIFHAPGPLWRLLQSGATLWRDNFNGIALAAGMAVYCFLLWLFAYVLFRAFPKLRKATAGRLWAEWPQNLLVGALGALAVPMLFTLLLISIFGIVLLPLYFLLLFFAGVIAYAAAAFWAGHRILPSRRAEEMRGLSLLLGILALQFFWMASAWWTVLPVLFLWTLAWGALLRSLRAAWK